MNRTLDRILFGDNQFFGINHLSEEKARQQAIKFQNFDNIVDVLQSARRANINGFMCTTHDLIEKVADIVRANPQDWLDFKFYPGMPYAHKYANAVTELGYFDALRKFLPQTGAIDSILRGSRVVLNKDLESMITLLIDAEMKMFHGLPVPVVFLQNVLTDLVQGLNAPEIFRIFASHVREKYNAEPGFITMNLVKLLPMLASVGITNPIVCANVNKVEFRMSGGIEGYRRITDEFPAQVIAMSVLASGALRPRDAIEWVTKEPYVSSILFGASSEGNIRSTADLIREFDQVAL